GYRHLGRQVVTVPYLVTSAHAVPSFPLPVGAGRQASARRCAQSVARGCSVGSFRRTPEVDARQLGDAPVGEELAGQHLRHHVDVDVQDVRRRTVMDAAFVARPGTVRGTRAGETDAELADVLVHFPSDLEIVVVGGPGDLGGH